MKTCACGKPAHAKGLCRGCYQKQYRADPVNNAKHIAWNVEYGRREPVKNKRNSQAAERYASDPETREYHAEYSRVRNAKPEVKVINNQQYEARKGDPDWLRRTREYNRKKYSGFTQDLVDRCLVLQNGCCDICTVRLVLTAKRHEPKRDVLCADHCHGTGAQRGLLCGACNTTLGYYEKTQRPRGLVIEPYERYLADPPVQRLMRAEQEQERTQSVA